jgi:putative hemolysin
VTRSNPFFIDSPANTLLCRAAFAAARPLLDRVLGLETCRTLYERARGIEGEDFETRALRALDVRPDCTSEDLARIPAAGPLIVAANHPHGAIDGLVVSSAVRRVRADVRIVANYVLARVPELADVCFFVDPFGGPAAAARSLQGLRAAHRWLRRGGALVMFPSGVVAPRRGADGSPVESAWHDTIGRLATSSRATILPIHIDGSNTRAFYAAGRIHATLRTALLARELVKARGRSIALRVGEPIAAGAAANPHAITRAARDAADRLASAPPRRDQQAPGSVATAVPSATLAAEIDALPRDMCLLTEGDVQVFCASADAIPHALAELGRLREITFRAAGEGTGRAADLDRFDSAYTHLFTWNRSRREIVGAYRIGEADRLVAAHGVEGLYTRTLFRYDERLIERLAPCLELGRAFVRPEYQRNYNALLLLWKGIGRFIARHPEYRCLFGTVSISARYADRSHAVLMAFLEQNHRDADLAALVEALAPPRRSPAAIVPVTRTVEDAGRLVSAIERDGKGVPVLLRQYLKLNARLIEFNVDSAFGDALDALMAVDLTAVDRSILTRYLGREETSRYLARHVARQSAA